MNKYLNIFFLALIGNSVPLFSDKQTTPVQNEKACLCSTNDCDSGINFLIGGDFIYWTAHQDNIEIAYSTNGNTVEGKVYRVDESWNPGFKVMSGLDFCNYGWDFIAQYTWYRSNDNKKSFETPDDLVVYDSYWFVNRPMNQATRTILQTEARWALHLNVIDLEIGKPILFGDHFNLRPQMGLKGVWNKQTYHLDYSGFSSLPPSNDYSSSNDLKSWGVGIRGGIESSWRIVDEFSLFGTFALTALWEGFKAKRFDYNLTEMDSHVFLRDQFHMIEGIYEWMLGMRWETSWSNESYHFSFQAAWEAQKWDDQNRFIGVPGAIKHGNGDLTFQGLTLGAFFSF